MDKIFAIFILFALLAACASFLDIPVIVLIGILVVIAAIAATIYVLFSKTCGEEEVTDKDGKKTTKKLTFTERLKAYWGVLLIAGIVIFFAIIILMGTGGGASGGNGRYGRGEQYDEQINSLADEYGADPDDVNEVYEYWEKEMR